MAQTLFSLDAPKRLTGATRLWQVVGVVIYFLVVLVGVVFAGVALPEAPAVALVHAAIGGVLSAITALLMFGHAWATGRRGYLVIGSTFLYVALVLFSFPLFFPGVLVPGEGLFGMFDTAPRLYFAWRFALPIGLTTAAWILYSDRESHRRPGLRPIHMWMGLAVAVGAFSMTTVLAMMPSPPTVLLPDGSLTAWGRLLGIVILLAGAIFLAVSLYCARTGAVMSRWLAATALLVVGETLVGSVTFHRFSLGWYFSRVLWLVAISLLVVALIWNLSRVDRANAEMAAADSLTGSSSRSAFLNAVHRETARANRTGVQVALLWVDLDGFKGINDQLGHQVGDVVLKTVVERIDNQVRLGDLVGRLGGDEFGILLCDYANVTQVHAVADRLLTALREPIRFADNVLHVTAAIGVATVPGDAQHADDLLQYADLAMYAAKQAGGDVFQDFTPVIGRQAVQKAQMRQDLAEALRGDEFGLYYQPILEADGGRLAGVEALGRWVREGQVLDAGQWIPFAEATGQIVPVGRVLRQRLVDDMPRWLEAFPDDFFVAVNLSVKELEDASFVEELRFLSDHARHIVVEVTESLELQESSQAAANLQRIRDAGMRVAIDDFGTGFSNFTRLERLRPSLLKIDRSLVRRAGTETEGGAAFLKAATNMATSLGCDVVAEGVETSAEARVVEEMGVRYVQGYRYGRPGPIEQWLGVSVKA